MRLLKTQIFEKKRQNFQWRKDFFAFFSRIIKHDKCQATFCKGPQGKLTSIVKMIRSFHRDIGGR